MDETRTYSLDDIRESEVLITLKEVYFILREKGYKPVNQFVGYLTTGDLTYISSYKDARRKIAALNRDVILEILVRKMFENEKIFGA